MLQRPTIGLAGLAATDDNTPLASPAFKKLRTHEWKIGNIAVRRHVVNPCLHTVAFQFTPKPWDFSLSPVNTVTSDIPLPPPTQQADLTQIGTRFSDAPETAKTLTCVQRELSVLLSSPELEDVIRNISSPPPPSTLIFTGYEFGGIVAQLFAVYYARSLCSSAEPYVLTFGKPLPGNLAFSKWYNGSVRKTSTFIAKHDCIVDYCKAVNSPGDPDDLYEDCRYIVLDNDETFNLECPLDLQAHTLAYYKRCFDNMCSARCHPPPRLPAPSDAARRIAGFMRRHIPVKSLRAVIKRFSETGILSGSHTTFKDLQEAMSSKTILAAAMPIATLLPYLVARGRLACGMPRVDEESTERKLILRHFLASFLIHRFPDEVFEYMGAPERRLKDSADTLVEDLRKIVSEVLDPSFCTTPHAFVRWAPFSTHLWEFLHQFNAWKDPYNMKIRMRIRRAIIAVYHADALCPEGSPENSGTKQEYRRQKRVLRSRLLKMGGPQALEPIDTELRGLGFAIDPQDDQPIPLEQPPRQPQPPSLAKPQTSLQPSKNERLAHELLLDPAFKIDGANIHHYTVAAYKESAVFKRAFWDSLADDLGVSPPAYGRLLGVLAEIVEGCCDLVPPREAPALRERVNTPAIKEMLDSEIMDWNEAAKIPQTLMLAFLSADPRAHPGEKWEQLHHALQCAPPGDLPVAFCNALEHIMDLANESRLRASNQLVRTLAPRVAVEGVEYLRSRFIERVRKFPGYGQITKKWIKTAALQLADKGRVRPEQLRSGDPAACRLITAHAAMHLITRDGPVFTPSSLNPAANDCCPEVLCLDTRRLNAIRLDYRLDRLSFCMVWMASQRLRPHASPPNRALLDRIVRFLNGYRASDSMDPDRPAALQEREALLTLVAEALDVHLTLEEKGLIQDALPGEDPLLRLLEVPELLWNSTQRCISDRWIQIITKTQDTSHPPGTPGIDVIAKLQTRIHDNASRLGKILDLSHRVHTPFYQAILSGIATCRH